MAVAAGGYPPSPSAAKGAPDAGLGGRSRPRSTVVAELWLKPLPFTLGEGRVGECIGSSGFFRWGWRFCVLPPRPTRRSVPRTRPDIDWSWKNCETTSTKKEHDLADAANASDRDKFHEQYQKALKKLNDVKRSASEVERLCTTILGMYGPSASVIPDLIVAKGETPPATTPTVATTPAAAPAAPRGHRHH